jgi:RNA polymerase sigma-70 factor (ECF subfamily)
MISTVGAPLLLGWSGGGARRARTRVAPRAQGEAAVGAPEPVTGAGDVAAAVDVATLVGRARSGCGVSFEALYRRLGPAVHGALLARLRPAEADEATQDVFVRAHARLSTLEDPGAFAPWVLAIARNLALDRLRARKREQERAAPLPEETPGRDEADRSAEELRARVLHHIQGLPEAYREPLVLRLVEGLSGSEIAAATGMTPGSVRVNLHRGMEMLRPLLRREGYP